MCACTCARDPYFCMFVLLGCPRVHQLLNRSEKLNWEIIFNLLQQTTSLYLPQRQIEPYTYQRTRTGHVQQQPQTERRATMETISERDATIIKAILTLIAAVIQDRQIQIIIYRNTEYRVSQHVMIGTEGAGVCDASCA